MSRQNNCLRQQVKKFFHKKNNFSHPLKWINLNNKKFNHFWDKELIQNITNLKKILTLSRFKKVLKKKELIWKHRHHVPMCSPILKDKRYHKIKSKRFLIMLRRINIYKILLTVVKHQRIFMHPQRFDSINKYKIVNLILNICVNTFNYTFHN